MSVAKSEAMVQRFVAQGSVRHLRTVTSSVTTNWGVDWSETLIARDLLQNFYDANRARVGDIQVALHERDVCITAPTPYPLERLFYLGSEKGPDEVGHYGEGFKVAATCLLRDHNITPIAVSAKQALCLRIAEEPVAGTALYPLVYDFFEIDPSCDGTRQLLPGCSQKLARAVQAGLTHFFFPANPLLGERLWSSADGQFLIYSCTSTGQEGHVFYRNLRRGEIARLPLILVIHAEHKSIEDKIKHDRDRKEFEELPSQLIVSARMKAAEALKSVEELKQQGRKVSCPYSDLCPIRYDTRSYWVILAQGVASLATVGGRVGVGLHLPHCYDRYLSWKTCSADLIFNARKKHFYLHVVVSTDAPEVEPDGNVVGCDLGIRRIAVTSKPRFFSCAALHTRVRQHQKLRSELQAKGTKSAKRHLQKSSRRWKRFQADVNHCIANEILAPMKADGVFVLEDLTGIRESCKCRRKHRGRFHRWSFAQLAQFLCYKAERKGIFVVRVDPRNSSRTCCKCGHCEKGNRRSQSRFRCLACGYCVNADYNAAQVLRQWGTTSLARVTSDAQSQPSCHSSSIAQAVEKLPTIECSLEQQRAASCQALAGSH